MAAITTTWTARDHVAFTAGTLSTLADCRSEVENALHRGTLSGSTTPSSTQVNNYLAFAKQELAEDFGFTWRRKYSYAQTAAGTWQYALPADFGGGAYVLRDITSNRRMSFVDSVTFDTLYPDVAGASQEVPQYYTIKDRELWLHGPANGAYTLELEYERTGDDSSADDVSYLPEIFRFKMCTYAKYQAFLAVHDYQAANIYKAEWEVGLNRSRKGDGRKKWANMGYMAKAWYYPGV